MTIKRQKKKKKALSETIISAGMKEEISALFSMKNKTKACATPNIPVHLVGGN